MNTLYYGDNLEILRKYIKDESVDLIYLDPPFKSNTDYNLLFKEPNGKPSQAQITAFEDTWHWTQETERTYQAIVESAPAKVIEMMQAFRNFVGLNDMMAYLTMMCIRLVELHRVLAPTGSIYLHCDPTASHYLKLVMDTIFGKKNFRNEILWHYRKWPSGQWQFQRNHDVILFFSKTDSKERVFNQVDLMERTASTLKRFGKHRIVSGHDDSGKRVPSAMLEEESLGVPLDDVWDIGRVPPIKQLFPTQKPEKLLSRIIRASSNENQVILDPFCGCGTAIVEAQKLRRQWLGIDITCLATNLIKGRLRDMFGMESGKDYLVECEPKDLTGARELAQSDRYQFQWWALSLIHAKPYAEKKKGADTGIDGYLYFSDEKGAYKTAIVQVKSGNVSVKDVRDLSHVVTREHAEMGVLLTLNTPTAAMKKEAAGMGFYESKHFRREYPKFQLITIDQLLGGAKPLTPPVFRIYRQAQQAESEQLDLAE